MEESEFIKLADQELTYIQDSLETSQDKDISDIDMLEGILYIKLTSSSEYVLNKQYKFKELWLSSPVSGGHHFKYDRLRSQWVNLKNLELRALLSSELGVSL